MTKLPQQTKEHTHRLEIEKIAGLPNNENACGVFTKRVTLYDGTIGMLISTILVKNAKNAKAGQILSDLFELATKKLEESTNGVLDALELAADSCRDFVSKEEVEVSFAHVFFIAEACYIAKTPSEIKVIVFKEAKVAEIAFEYGSGPIESGQIYLVATPKFLSVFDKSILLKGEVVNLEEIIDGLATEISSRNDQGEIGAAFILVKGEFNNGKEIEETRKEEEPTGDLETAQDEPSAVASVEIKGEQELEEEAPRPKARMKLPNFGGTKAQVLGSIRGLFLEIKSIRRGDIRAIFRLRRNLAIFAAVILVVLVLSATVSLRAKTEKAKMAKSNSLLAEASAKYTEGTALVELNKQRAREILIEADHQIKLALEIDPKNEKANQLSSDILAKLKETETQSSIDSQVVYEAADAINAVSLRGKSLVVATRRTIVEISLDDKSAREVAQVDGGKSLFATQDAAFVLADKVWQVDLALGKKEEIASVDKALDIAVFVGNVYLLQETQIAKFVPIEQGYAKVADYLNAPVQFDQNSRLAIDGLVWATSGNQVIKFLRGEKQDFAISGLTAPLGQLGSIYTTTNMGNLYLVDLGNSALLVVDKEGIYQKAFQSAQLSGAADIAVSEDQTKLYIAVGNKILEAPLR